MNQLCHNLCSMLQKINLHSPFTNVIGVMIALRLIMK